MRADCNIVKAKILLRRKNQCVQQKMASNSTLENCGARKNEFAVGIYVICKLRMPLSITTYRI